MQLALFVAYATFAHTKSATVRATREYFLCFDWPKLAGTAVKLSERRDISLIFLPLQSVSNKYASYVPVHKITLMDNNVCGI